MLFSEGFFSVKEGKIGMPAFFLLLTSPNIDSIDKTSVILANALKKSSIQANNSLLFPLSRGNPMQKLDSK